MANTGLSIRIFRLCSLRCDDEYDEDGQLAKEENIERYAARVNAGQPIFEAADSTKAGGNGGNVNDYRR